MNRTKYKRLTAARSSLRPFDEIYPTNAYRPLGLMPWWAITSFLKICLNSPNKGTFSADNSNMRHVEVHLIARSPEAS
uniref:Uncharacterized protein n=1 Tax=Romanomermis culicivorax TaxID=13658 RepID=A0A915JR38_ROMCU